MRQPADMPRDHAKVERAIVFELLRDNRDGRWSLTELAAELDIERSAVAAALERLREHGVVLSRSDAIDALGVIGI
jgi:biotin operon repressor